MPRKYRNTLKAHAHAQASLGKALIELATSHRVAAAAVERGGAAATPTGPGQFSEWIATSCEIAAAAERLLALEVELARRHGMTWDAVAEVLGVSRQSAWERFRSHERWNKARQISQLRQQRKADLFRRMTAGKSDYEVAILKQIMLGKQ
ncbi:hypothetical protein [Nocardia brevicatena]|uniref:hypothetical protein n=1 Tax=Nocardia brevicatena TaxID=37327 RepID=UPI0005927708|nr:hypothetical protein [Nocardia brevicatena]